ncbi:hypothetical protein B0H15DRAFT_807202 [Mycena belliarum]|uniref:Uncharacterized protein n=1 Tax=Mycena belliarum TaxID=1033014 RepID=A0AAD6XL61_9AGAR|nr:hypothetical protein B0H15DRAFT_807202 [Mycena belliae]
MDTLCTLSSRPRCCKRTASSGGRSTAGRIPPLSSPSRPAPQLEHAAAAALKCTFLLLVAALDMRYLRRGPGNKPVNAQEQSKDAPSVHQTRRKCTDFALRLAPSTTWMSTPSQSAHRNRKNDSPLPNPPRRWACDPMRSSNSPPRQPHHRNTPHSEGAPSTRDKSPAQCAGMHPHYRLASASRAPRRHRSHTLLPPGSVAAAPSAVRALAATHRPLAVSASPSRAVTRVPHGPTPDPCCLRRDAVLVLLAAHTAHCHIVTNPACPRLHWMQQHGHDGEVGTDMRVAYKNLSMCLVYLWAPESST